ncbi:hypothetical protein X975_22435, partial [Stegodyphus mimosarum]
MCVYSGCYFEKDWVIIFYKHFEIEIFDYLGGKNLTTFNFWIQHRYGVAMAIFGKECGTLKSIQYDHKVDDGQILVFNISLPERQKFELFRRIFLSFK